MDAAEAEFTRLVAAVLRRYFAQDARPWPSDTATADFAARLWALIVERGLPPPLPPGDPGAPREMSEAECTPLVGRVLAGVEDPRWADAARQLVKACFYPEFAVCRESYRAVTGDGACRRQEIPRVRKRISGTHCVDCPYWRSLTAESHGALLSAAWIAGPADFAAARSICLPEDFRALRGWIRRYACATGPR